MIDFPNGTLIRDEIVGITYQLGENQLLDNLLDEVSKSQIDHGVSAISESNMEYNETVKDEQVAIPNNRIETKVLVPESMENVTADSYMKPFIIFIILLVAIAFTGITFIKRGANRK